MSMRSSAIHVMGGLAIAAVALVGSPPEAVAQHHSGHGYSRYGHGYSRYGYGYSRYGHGYGGYGYGYGYGRYGYGHYGHGYGGYGYGYRSSYGEVRIEVSPKESRGEAQVYVNGIHAGTVNDFDGAFQRLYLDPGVYEIEVQLSGHRSFRRQILVSPGNTYNIRHVMEPLVAGELSEAAPDEPARNSTAATAHGVAPRSASGPAEASDGNRSASGSSDCGAVRIDVVPNGDQAQV